MYWRLGEGRDALVPARPWRFGTVRRVRRVDVCNEIYLAGAVKRVVKLEKLESLLKRWVAPRKNGHNS